MTEKFVRLKMTLPANVTVRTHALKEGHNPHPLGDFFKGHFDGFTVSIQEARSNRVSTLELDIPETEFEKFVAELRAQTDRKGG